MTKAGYNAIRAAITGAGNLVVALVGTQPDKGPWTAAANTCTQALISAVTATEQQFPPKT
jgi:hypothetical protein